MHAIFPLAMVQRGRTSRPDPSSIQASAGIGHRSAGLPANCGGVQERQNVLKQVYADTGGSR
jgi:hypothetical protein